MEQTFNTYALNLYNQNTWSKGLTIKPCAKQPSPQRSPQRSSQRSAVSLLVSEGHSCLCHDQRLSYVNSKCTFASGVFVLKWGVVKHSLEAAESYCATEQQKAVKIQIKRCAYRGWYTTRLNFASMIRGSAFSYFNCFHARRNTNK